MKEQMKNSNYISLSSFNLYFSFLNFIFIILILYAYLVVKLVIFNLLGLNRVINLLKKLKKKYYFINLGTDQI